MKLSPYCVATAVLATTFLTLLLNVDASAEVHFDGTTGGPEGLITGDITIGEADGLVTPGNDALLHSFELFNVLAGETIEFTHITPTINNILLRVTGAQSSLIDGQLESDANLWLLNPNGVLFGDQAIIDVAGSFRTNTVTGELASLVLSDGALFSVDANLNTLSVANPADFGFLPEAGQSIVSDNSLSTAVATSPQGEGSFHEISGGEIAGANLFHSFSEFSVFSNDTAQFLEPAGTTGPISNVVSRVTGGIRSFLTGTVEYSGDFLEGASLWLVNPAGLFVGNGVQFDVGRGLHLGAANGVVFGDGSEQVFDEQTPISALASGDPKGFLFTSSGLGGTLTVDGLEFDQREKEANGPTAGVSLAGSNVLINDTQLHIQSTPQIGSSVRVSAPQGGVLLANSLIEGSSTGNANTGRVLLDGARLIANGTAIELSNSGGNLEDKEAAVHLQFQDSVQIADTRLRTSTSGDGNSGAVLVFTKNFLMIGGRAETSSTGSGESNGVIISATGADEDSHGEIVLAAGAVLTTDTLGAQAGADAGILGLVTDGDLILAGSPEFPIRFTANAGPEASASGLVSLEGRTVAVRNLIIDANTSSIIELPLVGEGEAPSQGSDDAGLEGGVVQFIGTEVLSLQNSDISVSTSGTFDGGNLILDGAAIALDSTSLTSSTSGTGNAGFITIGTGLKTEFMSVPIADSLEIFDSVINATTTASGNGGSVIVQASGEVSASDLLIEVSSLAADNGGDAGELLLAAGGDIAVSRSTLRATSESGTPGFVTVSGANTELSDSTITISSASSISNDFGIALLALDQLDLVNSELNSSSSGTGDAQPIVLGAANVSLIGTDIRASATGSGDADRIFIDSGVDVPEEQRTLPAEKISLADSSLVSTTSGSGSFGQISLSALTIGLSDSTVEVETSSTGLADQENAAVLLSALDLSVEQTGILARTRGVSDAGRIVLLAPLLNVVGSDITNSSLGSGAAGQILVESRSIDPQSPGLASILDSRITSDTSEGLAGEIRVEADNLLVAGENAQISTNSNGSATAGTLVLGASALTISNGATIQSRATGSGNSNSVFLLSQGPLLVGSSGDGESRTSIRTDSERSQGGDVVLSSRFTTVLNHADIIASAGAEGSGGNVLVGSDGLLLSSSTLLAQAVNGDGGRIDISRTPNSVVLIDGESALNADSALGTSGSVDVDAPDTGIVSALNQQEARLAPEARLDQDECGLASRQAGVSSLIVRAKIAADPFAAGYLGPTGEPLRTKEGCL